MSRVSAAALAAIVMTAALPSTASAGCFGLLCPPVQTCGGGCYQPQQYVYQPQYVPPQYQAVQETVMVAPPRTIARHVPAQYETVMVPKTVMVAPPSVEYDRVPAQYATQERVQMVAPAQTYYSAVPVSAPAYSGGCRSNCGW